MEIATNPWNRSQERGVQTGKKSLSEFLDVNDTHTNSRAQNSKKGKEKSTNNEWLESCSLLSECRTSLFIAKFLFWRPLNARESRKLLSNRIGQRQRESWRKLFFSEVKITFESVGDWWRRFYFIWIFFFSILFFALCRTNEVAGDRERECAHTKHHKK